MVAHWYLYGVPKAVRAQRRLHVTDPALADGQVVDAECLLAVRCAELRFCPGYALNTVKLCTK